MRRGDGYIRRWLAWYLLRRPEFLVVDVIVDCAPLSPRDCPEQRRISPPPPSFLNLRKAQGEATLFVAIFSLCGGEVKRRWSEELLSLHFDPT